MKPKICAQCWHFNSMQGSGQAPRCFRPRKPQTDLVFGRTIKPEDSFVWYAKDVRADADDCGPTGKYWKARA
jgi:hypothetical protein